MSLPNTSIAEIGNIGTSSCVGFTVLFTNRNIIISLAKDEEQVHTRLWS